MDFLMVSGKNRKEILIICIVISFCFGMPDEETGFNVYLIPYTHVKSKKIRSCLD
jgi:hypothetical protein